MNVCVCCVCVCVCVHVNVCVCVCVCECVHVCVCAMIPHTLQQKPNLNQLVEVGGVVIVKREKPVQQGIQQDT